jgi:hypothetical protein
MWYNTGNSIGLATSNNGIRWEETTGESIQPSPDWWVFDNSRVVPSDVFIISSDKLRLESAVYWMYYTGFTEETLQLPSSTDVAVYKSLPGLAISQDGQHWQGSWGTTTLVPFSMRGMTGNGILHLSLGQRLSTMVTRT